MNQSAARLLPLLCVLASGCPQTLYGVDNPGSSGGGPGGGYGGTPWPLPRDSAPSFPTASSTPDAPTIVDAGPADTARNTGDAAADTGDAAQDTGDADVVVTPGAATRILSDLEDGKVEFAAAPGVLASWSATINYAVGRKEAFPASQLVQTIVPPRGTSQKACHMQAPPYEDGVDLLVDFHASSGPPDAGSAHGAGADLTDSIGLAFWARSDADEKTLYVAVADGAVNAGEEFWLAELNGHPWPSRRIQLSARWERFVLLYEDFRLGAITAAAAALRPLQTQAVHSFHFLAGVGGSPVDFWIDDLALLCRGPCPQR